MTRPIRIAVTGPCGSIGYSILFRIAAGDLFGRHQPIELRLLARDTPESQARLKGTMMELADCAFPLLSEMRKPFMMTSPSKEKADVLTYSA